MNTKAKKIIKYVGSPLLAVILLFLTFRKVDWKAFGAVIDATDWHFVALIMLCGGSAFVFRALRWQLLLRSIDPKISFLTTLNGVNIGNLANCVIPFAGEFFRCGVISKNSGPCSYDKTLGTIALERIWDLVSIVIVVVAVLIFKNDVFGTFFSQNILGPTAGRFKGWTVIIAATVILLISAAIWAIAALRERNSLCGKIYGVFKGMVQGFSTCFKMNGKWLFLLYTLIIWALYWMMTVNASKAIAEVASLTLADTLFIMAVGNLSSVIPVPGGFGAYHYIIALTLSSLFGFSWETGLLFATLCHESQAITMITTGFVSYIIEGRISKLPPEDKHQ